MNTKEKTIKVSDMIIERFNESNQQVKEIVYDYIYLNEDQKQAAMSQLIEDVEEFMFEDEEEALNILAMMDFKNYLLAMRERWINERNQEEE
jgi:hypothetical protein